MKGSREERISAIVSGFCDAMKLHLVLLRQSAKNPTYTEGEPAAVDGKIKQSTCWVSRAVPCSGTTAAVLQC